MTTSLSAVETFVENPSSIFKVVFTVLFSLRLSTQACCLVPFCFFPPPCVCVVIFLPGLQSYDPPVLSLIGLPIIFLSDCDSSYQSHLVVELRHWGDRKQSGHVVHVQPRAHIDPNRFRNVRLSPFAGSIIEICAEEPPLDVSMGGNGDCSNHSITSVSAVLCHYYCH